MRNSLNHLHSISRFLHLCHPVCVIAPLILIYWTVEMTYIQIDVFFFKVINVEFGWWRAAQALGSNHVMLYAASYTNHMRNMINWHQYCTRLIMLDFTRKVTIWISKCPLYSAASSPHTPLSTEWNIEDVTCLVPLRKATTYIPLHFSGRGGGGGRGHS